MNSYNLPKNAVILSKMLCRQIVKPDDTVVDATMGNGNDTLFLCELVGTHGKVFSFDIQEQAVSETKNKLETTAYLNSYKLILDSHCNIHNYIKQNSVKLILFNLGYLPKGNHEITTKAVTTLEAVNSAIKILDKNGVVILVVYPGHKEGLEEKNALKNYIKDLDQKNFNVLSCEYENQINNPPMLISIEKLF